MITVTHPGPVMAFGRMTGVVPPVHDVTLSVEVIVALCEMYVRKLAAPPAAMVWPVCNNDSVGAGAGGPL